MPGRCDATHAQSLPVTPRRRAAQSRGGFTGSLRNAHLFYETSLQDTGALIGAAGLFIALMGGLLDYVLQPAICATPAWFRGLVLSGGVLLLGTGMGLSQLSPQARLPAMGAAVVGLFFFPVATPLSIYLLVLVSSQKGRFVLSPAYASIVLATSSGTRRSMQASLVFVILILLTAMLGWAALESLAITGEHL